MKGVEENEMLQDYNSLYFNFIVLRKANSP